MVLGSEGTKEGKTCGLGKEIIKKEKKNLLPIGAVCHRFSYTVERETNF